MSYINTGNTIVDSVGTMNFTGNVVPNLWYTKLVRKNGKPYLLAILLLSDIVYWFRPTEIRDEASGNTLYWKKSLKRTCCRKHTRSMPNSSVSPSEA